MNQSMNRRQFVLFALASVVAGRANAFKPQSITHVNSNKKLFGAYNDAEGQHFVGRLALNDKHYDFVNSDSVNIDSMQIPFRAHDILPLSDHKSLSFGRRPNNKMIICDFETKQQRIVSANEGRHFYGHGCVDKKGKTLFTTENDYDNNSSKTRGVIGIRDSHSFEQIGEYESYGIGPHDIHLMPDNKTLVVANGGIQTHPDYGRRKLNLDTMQPSLVFVDIESGKKIDEYRLDNHQLSIRHLAITPKGGVAVATQYQGKKAADTPNYLLAWLDDDGLKTLNNTQQFTRSCRGYMGDIAVDSNAQILAASSPRGNSLSLWDIKQARLIKEIEISGPCGLCFDAENQEFLVSNDKGIIYKVALHSTQNTIQNTTQNTTQLLATQYVAEKLCAFPVKWDNHMMLRA